jgi:hypothetical protein
MPFNRIQGIVGLPLLAIAIGLPAAHAADEVQNNSTTTAAPVPSTLQPVSQDQLDRAGSMTAVWLHPNGSYAQTRYYPGSQINRTTSRSSDRFSSSRRPSTSRWKRRRL